MGRRIHDSLIPARFLSTMGYLIAASLVYFSKDDNIRSSLAATYSTSEYDTKDSEITAAITLVVTCLAIQILSMLSGYTLFMVQLNAIHVLLNAIGAILTCWFILDSWHVTSFWYLFTFFSLLPLALEISYMLNMMCCNIQS
mmetsp:Transcript_17162/g.23895  ORF Transcript_17162/g.23895 Transcript_17162/m.23895 type:complete len:142 (-) Transcript_17162:103-528(-)